MDRLTDGYLSDEMHVAISVHSSLPSQERWSSHMKYLHYSSKLDKETLLAFKGSKDQVRGMPFQVCIRDMPDTKPGGRLQVRVMVVHSWTTSPAVRLVSAVTFAFARTFEPPPRLIPNYRPSRDEILGWPWGAWNDRQLNPVPADHKSGVLTTTLMCSCVTESNPVHYNFVRM
jgi:hypothetical protein